MDPALYYWKRKGQLELCSYEDDDFFKGTDVAGRSDWQVDGKIRSG